MKKFMMVLSFVAIIAIMVVAVPAGATDDVYPDGYYLSTDRIVEFIFAYMRALGYGFEVDAIEQWETIAQEWILEQVYEFLDTIPSVSGLAQWVLPWSLGWDGWGNMIGNASFLEDMEDFLDWLNYKYNLENNSVQVQVPSWTFGEYYGFLNGWKFTIANYYDSGTYRDKAVWVGAYEPTYQCYGIFIRIADSNEFGVLMKSTGAFVFRYRSNNSNKDPNIIGPNTGSGNDRSSVLGENYYYYRYDSSVFHYPEYVPFVGLPIYQFESVADALLAFDITDPDEAPSMSIVTGNIVLPGDDPDYTTGDGVTIIDDGEGITKIYLEVEFPDSINVKNLPSSIIPNNIEAINLSDAFAPISSFVNTYSDAIGVITDISYRLPVPLWTIAFALIAVDILAGIIHTFKEH